MRQSPEIVAERDYEMEEKVIDRRKEHSLRVIRSCFLQMLKKEPIERISVGKLCEKANINRSTFYRHYADLYDLLDTIVDECFQELFHEPVAGAEKDGDFLELGYSYILRVCVVAERKKELYRQLLFGRTNTKLEERMIESTVQLYLTAHEESSYVPSKEAVLHYRFLAYGIIGLWISWLKEDCKIPKEFVASTAVDQIAAFFQKMNERFWTKERKKAEEMRI